MFRVEDLKEVVKYLEIKGVKKVDIFSEGSEISTVGGPRKYKLVFDTANGSLAFIYLDVDNGQKNTNTYKPPQIQEIKKLENPKV